MTKEEQLELVKKVVPEIIIEDNKDNKWFSDEDRDYIKSFDGDVFQEYANKIINDDYIIEEEDNFGGYEGAGDITYVVYSLTNLETNEKIYFKISGWYDSWNGTEWINEPVIVGPKEVIKIEWEELNDD
jgi:hypothetical protein